MDSQPPSFLTAEWRILAMLNYVVDPDILRTRVPTGTELDFWNGNTYVSIVGFRFLRTRVRGIAIPLHVNFDEVNLRYYVRRRVPEGWRRGVVFIKEIVPRWCVAQVARTVYNENYVCMPMRSSATLPSALGSGKVEYGWNQDGQWHGLTVQIAGEPAPAEADSEARFITEHYWGYARQRDGSTVEYQVEHPSWHVWTGKTATLDCDVRGLYGPEFAECIAGPPSSSLVADGSAVIVRRGRKIR